MKKIQPKTRLIAYQVEVRAKLTGYWEVHSTMRPLFKWEVIGQPREFFCWSWEVLRECIVNQSAAEDAARARAINVARTLRRRGEKEEVRVEAYHLECGYKVGFCIWENGLFKDC